MSKKTSAARPSAGSAAEPAAAAPPGAASALPYEQAFARLESLVDALEGGEVPLAALVAKFEEGHKLLQTCQQHLHAAELRIEQLKLDEAGAAAFGPLPPQSES